MSPLDMDYPDDMEEDTLDDPKHVRVFDAVLDEYGFEPINSWRAEDVAKAFAALGRELQDRGAELPNPLENTDDGC